MDKFNLIEKPWIPCLMLETNETEDLSLFDTLTKAHKIKEITDNSPLVVVSLHRLLLAILHRNFGPKTFEIWKELWRKGYWDAEKLKEYFDEYENRFNLFDSERPFYQYPEVKKADGVNADIAPFELLMQEKASGNNATLFDHSFVANSQVFPPNIAARYLIARQAYSFAGGVGFPFNLGNSTLVAGFSTFAIGNNLFETLALNLVRYPHEDTFIYETDEDEEPDMPFWERKNLDQAIKRDKNGTMARGYLDYLTWQSRRIKLISNEDLQVVKSCQHQQNFKLSDDFKSFDPFKVYVKSTNKKNKKGYKPIDFQENKSLWRDSHTLFRQANSIKGRSSLFSHLATIGKFIADGEIDGEKKYSFAIFGLINDQASVSQWFQERLPLPLELLRDEELLNKFETAINFAEGIGECLRQSLNKLAYELLPNIAGRDRGEKSREIAKNFLGLSVFWSRLEVAFKNFIVNLPRKKDEVVYEWFQFVELTAVQSLDETAKSLSGSATEQEAIVKAKNKFWYEKSVVVKENPQFKFYLSENKGGEE